MAARSKSKKGAVTFMRGGQEVTLFEDPNLIAVRLQGGNVAERLTSRLHKQDTGVPASVRYVGRIPGRRVSLFYCPRDERDRVMDNLRANKEAVRYCSHVLRRSDSDDCPGTDIGIDDRVFVEFKSRPTAANIASVEKAHGLRAIWSWPERPSGIVFELTRAAKVNPLKIARKLGRNRLCSTAEPCLIEHKVPRAIPMDPGFRKQWHLLNTGEYGGTPGADCNAPAAWDHTWGDASVTVAVIDDGFDLGHPDLSRHDKIVHPYDATEQDLDPSPASFGENHGTACAGVAIASRGGSGLVVGVAPDCRWMPIRHAGQIGDFEEALAFYHAYRHGADVISCSWGPPDAYLDEFWPMPSITRFVIDLCVERGRDGKGIPVLFAAGNGNEPLALDGYASYENVIAVAASTSEDEKAWYSDYGNNVWVCAPSNGGELGVVTTDRRGQQGYNAFSDYVEDFGGTSSSTPLVAGVVALMLSVNPNLTEHDIRDLLRRTARKIGGNPVYEYEDEWGTWYSDAYNQDGHSEVFGWGRVDAGAAVAEARSGT